MKKLLTFIMASVFWSGSSSAAPILINAGVGIFGYEVDVATKLNDNLGFRIGTSWSNGNFGNEATRILYNSSEELFNSMCANSCMDIFSSPEVSMDMNTYNFFVDYYPFGGALRVTAGILYGEHQQISFLSEVNAEENTDISLGDYSIDGDRLGSVRTDIQFGDYTPYAGIGWAGGFASKSRLNFFVNIGVFFPHNVAIDVHAMSPDGESYYAEAKSEADKLQEKFKEYYIPVPHASVGVSWRFYN